MARQDILTSMSPFPMTQPNLLDIEIINRYSGRPRHSNAPFSRFYAEYRLSIIGKQVYNLLLQMKSTSKQIGDQ